MSNFDLTLAKRFITSLTGGDKVTFQTFSDRDGLRRVLPSGKSYDPNAAWRHDTLDRLESYLMCLNAKGSGIFVMINVGDGQGRTAKNVVLVRALFIDTDGAPYPSDLPLRPHFIVQSSPGRWHLYWLVSGLELADFSTLQKALAKHYGSDPNVHDLSRVMRLPGFYHCKAEPVIVRLLHTNGHPPFTAAEVFAAWPSLPERLEHERMLALTNEKAHAELLKRVAKRKRNPSADTCDQTCTERLLQAHHDTVASAGDGTRHDTLLRSARALGGYIAGGYLEPFEVEQLLQAAAESCGLPDAEAAEAIRWGLEKGKEKPLEFTKRLPREALPIGSCTKRKRLAGWYR